MLQGITQADIVADIAVGMAVGIAADMGIPATGVASSGVFCYHASA